MVVKDPNEVDLIRVFGRLPWLRRLIARIGYGTKRMFDGLTYLYDNDITPQISYSVSHSYGRTSVGNLVTEDVHVRFREEKNLHAIA